MTESRTAQFVDSETRLIATVTFDSPEGMSDDEARLRLIEGMYRAVAKGPIRMRKDVVQGISGNNKG